MTQRWPDWRGETVVIVASGPSAKDVNLAAAKGKCRFVAINESWRLCPWADALYACDGAWWTVRGAAIEFAGLRLSQDAAACRARGLTLVRVDRKFDDLSMKEVGRVGDGGNSGFQVMNLVCQWGATKIVLVGFDMRLDRGEHWHGRHPQGLNNPSQDNVRRWIATIDAAAPRFKALGVQVLNASSISALAKYPKCEFEKAVA